MKHVWRIGIALGIYLITVGVVHFLKQRDAAQLAAEESSVQMATVPVTEADRSLWRKTEERVRRLSGQEEQKARQTRAAAQTRPSRRQLQLARVGSWNALIRTNMLHYHQLYNAAWASGTGQIVCNICDSFSYMPCIMCSDHKGKCMTCDGSGHREGQELCPSCVGTGKCYLCAGSGKMFCPFCDDGMIRVDWPLPHYFPPAE
jgi:hypothetical protein